MIYTKLVNKTIKLMYDKHKDQVDKNGIPYVFHPWHVAESMIDEKRTVVALLHDIVEDTNTTFEELEKMGYDDEIIEALKVLTHDKSVNYDDYIKKISMNPIARDVKIADLKHNLDRSRLDESNEKLEKKYEQYNNSLSFLINNKRMEGED